MISKDFISQAAESIRKAEEKRSKLVECIRPLIAEKMNPNEKMIEPVKEISFTGSAAGVDSGFAGKDFLSLDLVLIRAKGVVFDYKNGKLQNAEYWPNYFSFPEPVISNRALQKEDISTHKSLQRLVKEIEAAQTLIEKFKPDYCFLDGSIIPQHADKPRQNSKMIPFYKEVIKKFESLYLASFENNCTLIGCVEDSRGTRFKSLVEKNFSEKLGNLNDCFDTAVLDSLLEEGQRSFSFSYAEKTSGHPVLNDFTPRLAELVRAFYVKPCALDRPLRVEFLLKGEGRKKIDEIASVVNALSRMHREYAYPSVLIEADLRAKLHGDEIKIICDKIFDKIGGTSRIELRRGKRPF